LRTAVPPRERVKLALFGLFAAELLSALAIALSGSILIAVVVAVLAPIITIALLKGRPILVIAGFIGLVEFGLGSLLWLWGALRLARPESAWARAFYGPEKLAKARRRYSQKRLGVGATAVRRPTTKSAYPTINVCVDARSVHLHDHRVPADDRSARPSSELVRSHRVPNSMISRRPNRSEPT
jgi:hypothetical protein